MPENINTSEIRRLKTAARGQVVRQGGMLHREDMKKLVAGEELEFVGGGGECIVVGRPGDQETVIAVDYRDYKLSDAKACFFRQRIMETLFPHNFPHFKTTLEGVTAKERVYPDKDSLIEYPFTVVEEAIDELGLPVFIDGTRHNFAVAADGGEYYLDRVDGEDVGEWDVEAIRRYMKGQQMPEEKVESVERYIKVLKRLEQADD